jgi:hypothetical protein
MRTYKEVERVSKEFVLKEIFCDKCEKSMGSVEYSINGSKFVVDFGYGSRHDNEIYEIELCDDCCDWMFGQLKTKREP